MGHLPRIRESSCIIFDSHKIVQAIYQEFVINFGKISFPITFSDYDQRLRTELHQFNRQAMKLSVADTNSKTLDGQTRNSRSRSTRVKHKSQHSRSGASVVDLFQPSPSSRDKGLSSEQKLQLTKRRILRFFQTSQLILYAQLMQGDPEDLCQIEVEQKNLGQENSFTIMNQHLFNVKDVLREREDEKD
jgi:hypothetical protein